MHKSCLAFVLGISILLSSSLFGQVYDFKILDEATPPGGWAVIKVKQYEPRPIASGQGCFNYGATLFEEDARLVVESAKGDVIYRIDHFKPGDILFSFEAPLFDLGLDREPFIFIAMRVNPDAIEGSGGILSFDAEDTFIVDPDGTVHQLLLYDGNFTVGGLSITCISPRSGSVRAGDRVTITGLGFQPGLKVQFWGVPSASIEVIDATTIVAIAPDDFEAEEVEVWVQNPDKHEETFMMRRFGCFE